MLTATAPAPAADPAAYLDRLEALFASLDEAYDAAARSNGFRCRGCTDNCCETEFHHHTLVEYLYIRRGVAGLAPAERAGAVERSRSVIGLRSGAPAGAPLRVMCPLNAEGRCVLYGHRPMICRLHGVPSRFRHPVHGWVDSPGCHDFDRQCPDGARERLDRTPAYRALAELEQSLRGATGFSGRVRMTVAQMVVADLAPEAPGAAAGGPPQP
jgi:Fe-S-cluster containining protein